MSAQVSGRMRSRGARRGAAGELAVQRSLRITSRSPWKPLSITQSPETAHTRTHAHTQLMAETSAHVLSPGGDRLHFSMSALSTVSTYV